MTIHQISIFLENRAGQLADITAILSENHVDLRAISIAETADYGVLRLIVDDAQRASAILLERGFILTMTPVVPVAVPDRPGGLNEVLQVISRAEIDVEYMYSVFGQKEGLAYMIFRVGDPERFNAVLASSGLAAVPGDELGTH